VLHPDRLAVSLRALGGLLVGGHWDLAELQNLRFHSAENSFERELFEILLGWRYSPQITMLENDLQHEREEHKQNVLKLSQEILRLHEQNADLEQHLDHMQKEHGLRGEELDQANKKTDELQRSVNQTLQEKKTLQDTLQRSNQEKQSLRNSVQDLTREKATLESQVAQWQRYADQLEQGMKLSRPKGSKKN
jgi:chromosome segregation ATPase